MNKFFAHQKELPKEIQLLSMYLSRNPMLFNHYLPSKDDEVTLYLDKCVKKLPIVNMEIYNQILDMLNNFNISNEMREIKGKVDILACDSDNYYLPHQQREFYEILKKANVDVTLNFISSNKGHDAFLLEEILFEDYIANRLNKLDKVYDESKRNVKCTI